MPHRPASLPLLAGALLMALSAGSGPASAEQILETVYLPTSSVVGLPSSTILPTSYIVPTSYMASSYIPTSAIYTTSDVLVPTTTTYLAPSYRTVRYRPRRYVERTAYYSSPNYLPLTTTSYLAPTSYLTPTSYVVPTRYLATSNVEPTSYLVSTGLVTTSASSSMCCDSGPSQAPAASPSRTSTTRPAPSNGGSIVSTPSSGGSGERLPSGAADPAGSMDDGKSSRVVPGVPASAAQVTPPPQTPVESAAPVGTKPGDELDPNSIKIDPPGKTGSEAPPGLPKLDLSSRRESQRPAFSGPSEARNILRGRVVSFESGRPEESVTIILTNKTGAFVDRTAMTDADGEFKVSLPQGDWVVKVKMPSGSILPVGRDGYLTASSGRITDPSGRNVGQFTITR